VTRFAHDAKRPPISWSAGSGTLSRQIRTDTALSKWTGPSVIKLAWKAAMIPKVHFDEAFVMGLLQLIRQCFARDCVTAVPALVIVVDSTADCTVRTLWLVLLSASFPPSKRAASWHTCGIIVKPAGTFAIHETNAVKRPHRKRVLPMLEVHCAALNTEWSSNGPKRSTSGLACHPFINTRNQAISSSTCAVQVRT
jgi:hypothetical protein